MLLRVNWILVFSHLEQRVWQFLEIFPFSISQYMCKPMSAAQFSKPRRCVLGMSRILWNVCRCRPRFMLNMCSSSFACRRLGCLLASLPRWILWKWVEHILFWDTFQKLYTSYSGQCEQIWHIHMITNEKSSNWMLWIIRNRTKEGVAINFTLHLITIVIKTEHCTANNKKTTQLWF